MVLEAIGSIAAPGEQATVQDKQQWFQLINPLFNKSHSKMKHLLAYLGISDSIDC